VGRSFQNFGIRSWGCGGGGGVMPRGAEEGERGDVVRGRAPLLLIGNSREGAAPRGACLAGSSAVSGPCGAVARQAIQKSWNSGGQGTARGVMGREPSLGPVIKGVGRIASRTAFQNF